MTIESLVWFVFVAIVVVAIIGALWFAIGYAESKYPALAAWNAVRVAFVLLVVFLGINVLLALIGHLIVRLT